MTFRTVRKRILEGVFRLQRRKEHITFIMVRGYITTMYLLRKINVLIMFITVHRNILQSQYFSLFYVINIIIAVLIMFITPVNVI